MTRTNPYLSRLTSQHAGRPRFRATVDGLTGPLAELSDFAENELARAFDLDTAVGVQLDAVGEWVGRSRYVALPVDGVYFSWGESGTGWQETAWKGLFDPISQLTRLPDDIYRILLKAKVAANRWDGTRDGAYDVWDAAFADMGATILIEDYQNMHIAIAVAGLPPSPLLEALLVEGYLPLKPEGVGVRYYALPPDDSAAATALFAWDCDSPHLNGWNVASRARLLYPEGYAAPKHDGPFPPGPAAAPPGFAWDRQDGGWDTGLRETPASRLGTVPAVPPADQRWFGWNLVSPGVDGFHGVYRYAVPVAPGLPAGPRPPVFAWNASGPGSCGWLTDDPGTLPAGQPPVRRFAWGLSGPVSGGWDEVALWPDITRSIKESKNAP